MEKGGAEFGWEIERWLMLVCCLVGFVMERAVIIFEESGEGELGLDERNVGKFKKEE